MSTDLAKSAMLVSVTIINGGLLGERKDKTATAQMERRYNLRERRGKASKFLIDRQHPKVKAVVAASQRVREVLYKYTMPWGDDKTRLLPVNVHETFITKMRDAETELREAWDEYLQVYPALVADSERDLSGLYNRNEYPTVGGAKDLFVFRTTYWPLPTSGNFVAKIADDAATYAKAEMSLEIERRLKASAMTLVERGKEHVKILLTRLESFKSKKDGKLIRDSLTNNCSEIADLINEMNITKNPDISALAGQISVLGMYSAESLRASAGSRQVAKDRAKRILAEVIELETLSHDVNQMVADASEYQF